MKHLLFDFDGTLVRSIRKGYEIGQEIAKAWDLSFFSWEEFQELTLRPIPERMARMGIRLRDLPKYHKEFLIRYREILPTLELEPGMREVLENLTSAGFTLTVLSSNGKENIRIYLETHKIPYFSDIVATSGLFDKAHHIRKIIRKKRWEKADVLYIGDELRDILACRKAGIKIAAVSWGFDRKSLLEYGKPDFLADTPQELFEIITNI